LQRDRCLHLRELRFGRSDDGRVAHLLPLHLVAIDARNQHPWLHAIAFVYRPLDQPARHLERDVHLCQLDIARNVQLAFVVAF
jgi:hypothetical protein